MLKHCQMRGKALMRIELKQGTDPWHDWRKGGIGGSEVAAVMNDSPYSNRNTLLLEKQGKQKPKPFNSYLAAKGHDAERNARDYVEGVLQTTLTPMCYQHDEHSHIRASLDGITPDEQVIFEAKLVGAELFHRVSTEDYIPIHHYWQMQYGMYASGAIEAIYAVVQNLSGDVHMVRCDRNDTDISELKKEIDQFWLDVKNNADVEPDIIDMDRDNEFVTNMDKYFQLEAQIKELSANQKMIKQELINQAQNKKMACRYGTISSYIKQGSLSYGKFVKDHKLNVPEDYRSKPTTVHKITRNSNDGN